MSNIGVITDTVCCIPEEKIKEYDIGIVPFAININGKSYLDQIDIFPDEFWKMFSDIKEFSTGAPAQGIFIDAFKKMSQDYDEIVCTFVAKGLSAMQESAAQARDMFIKENPDIKIEIVDSMKAAGAQGFVALAMAKAAADGKDFPQVINIGKEMSEKTKYFIGMQTLKYLIKCGRAPKTAYVGELMGVKPIVGMVNNTGQLENLARAKGTKGCIEKIVSMVGDYSDTSKSLHLNVHYTNNIDEAKKLQEMLSARYQYTELFLTPFTPVMCGSTGPVLSVSFYSD